MKNSKFILFSFASLLLLGTVACKNKVKEEENVSEAAQFQNSLSAQDTIDATNISNKFVETLKKGDIEGAVAQLVLVDTARKVMPLPDDVKNSVLRTFRTFPVKDYSIQTFEFIKPDSNFVRYQIVFAEATEDRPAATMSYSTMPMKIDGKWYLTLPGYLGATNTKTGVPTAETAKAALNDSTAGH